MIDEKGSRTPAVSVIIPAYNEEKYIKECLASISAQTFQDFEAICVDNGSSDSTTTIIHNHIASDKRFSILETPGNAGDARNAGMRNARGKYLLFLDADDFFDEHLLEKAVAEAERTDADIVLFGGKRFDDQGGTPSEKMEFVNFRYFPDKPAFSALENSANLFQMTTPAPWSKLFKKEFIDGLKLEFQSLRNSNDLYFTLTALSNASRIAGVNEPLIYYRINRQGSLQSSKAEFPLCFFEALRNLKGSLLRFGIYEHFRDTFDRQLLSTIRYNLDTAKTEEAADTIIEYLEENWDDWLALDWHNDSLEHSKAAKTLRERVMSMMSDQNEVDAGKKAKHHLGSRILRCLFK